MLDYFNKVQVCLWEMCWMTRELSLEGDTIDHILSKDRELTVEDMLILNQSGGWRALVSQEWE